MSRKYRCPYCNKSYERDKLITHVNRVHSELIPEGFTASRVVFNHINKTTGSFCRICHEPTEWNEKAGRYNVLCGKQACKDAMRDEYKKNMLRVRGTYNILEDPEQQKLMLSHRKISGEYQFSDGGKVGYTGTYEKNCLEFMDVVMQIPSTDILSPGPTIEYTYEGKKHYYIPDFYYIPYNLIIEVKDGGDNPNNKSSVSMDSSREKTIEKERLITNKGEYNYIRLTNNNFQQLIAVFMDIKANLLENKGKPVIHINESFINEFYIKEDKDYTKYISNFINKSIDFNYKAYDINSKEAKSYTKTNSYTKKYLNYLSENTGEILVDTDNNKLIGYIFVGKSKDKGFISTLEVVKEYRGYGFGNILIEDAINKYNAIDLVVYKDNKVALDMYKKLGFVVIGEDKNGKAWYMKLKSKLSKDDEVINEACKNIDSARSFVDDVKKLSKKYNANFFIVTDGASGYSNGNGGSNPAVKNARNRQIEWEKANGFDPYEDWGDRRKIEKFNEELNKWDYGVLIGGTVYTDSKKIRWDMYRTIPLKDIEKLHVGVCWDFVNYQAEWFKRNGIDYRNYLIIVQKSSNPNDIDTHTFNIISIDDKLYWFESSWQSHQGIHSVKDYKTVLNVMLKDYKNWYNVSAYSYDTKGLANHLNGSQFIKRATKNCIYYKKNDDYQNDLIESTDVVEEADKHYNYNSLASMDLYRITVDGIGIYEAFRRRVDFKIWKRFLDSPDVNWLDKPPLQYRNGMESYFTAIGYDRFTRDTLPYINKFIRSKDIQVEHIFGIPNNKRLVYMDEYQVVVK